MDMTEDNQKLLEHICSYLSTTERDKFSTVDGSYPDIWDGTIFYDFVKPTTEQEATFKDKLDACGVGYDTNFVKLCNDGIGVKAATVAFCISSEVKGKRTVTHFLKEYVQSRKGQDYQLVSLAEQELKSGENISNLIEKLIKTPLSAITALENDSISDLCSISANSSWSLFLEERGQLGTIKIEVAENAFAISDIQSIKQTPQATLELGRPFRFHIPTKTSGYGFALQSQESDFYPLRYGRKNIFFQTNGSNMLFPSQTEAYVSKYLVEEEYAGSHQYIFITLDDSEQSISTLQEIKPFLKIGSPLSTHTLDSMASKLAHLCSLSVNIISIDFEECSRNS